jgi:hypothetical protein
MLCCELRKQQLELAMGPAMRAQSVRATEHTTNALWLEVDHAMLQAIACEQQLELAMEASDGGTMCAR